jgi:hypothetical protein
MREISRSVQIDKHAKKCVDYTVRTNDDVAEPYDTWLVLVGSHVDKLAYDTWQ